MELTEATIRKLLNSRWQDVFGQPLKLCDKCGHYGSTRHQGIWCNRCPGKMIITNYVVKFAMENYSKYGSGVKNSFWAHLAEVAGEVDWDKEDKYTRYSKGMDWIYKNTSWIRDIIKDELTNGQAKNSEATP